MGEALKEFGKHLLNLALAIAIYLLIQPFLKGNYSFKLILVGITFYFTLIILGIGLINLGNKLEKGGDKDA
jgi:hypothetical protein